MSDGGNLRPASRALARHRHAAGLTQPQLAELSVTTIGHAETGRTWQSRPFWEHADKFLTADGELIRLHEAYRATEVLSEIPISLEEPAEIEDASVVGGTVIQDPLELSATLMTDERAYMARWLALEVLMTDETVCEDEELFDRLSALQDKWQQEALARRGMAPAS
jgi:hypothetical protein